MCCCSWKCWHSAKNNRLALAFVTACGMHKEHALETLAREAFGIDCDEVQLLTFHDFRDKLSGQGLGCSPLKTHCPGNSAMRAVTRITTAQNKRACAATKPAGARKPGHPPRNTSQEATTSDRPVVTPDQLKLAKKHTVKSRMCGDLTAISHHIMEMAKLKHGMVCTHCGEPACTMCTICPDQPALDFYPSKGPNKGKSCFVDYHNDCCFGLAHGDHQVLLGKSKSDWSPPMQTEIKKNSKHIKTLGRRSGSNKQLNTSMKNKMI